MKTFHRSYWIAALSAVLTLLPQLGLASAPHYEPAVLGRIVEQVRAERAQGHTPIVVFDLDDTLINTRARTLRILRDFAARPEVRAQFPDVAARIARTRVSEIRFLLTDTFQDLGISDAEFAKQATAFWATNFFTDAYAGLDLPNRGAVAYANHLAVAGAKIVYLTGRDLPRMGLGTATNLARLGFPLDHVHSLIELKPTKDGADLAFKISALPGIASQGTIVASFENEPMNINAMQQALPQATMVFIDTIHSPAPDQPAEGVHWVHDFTGR